MGRRRVFITVELLMEFLKKRNQPHVNVTCLNPLPDDATFVTMFTGPEMVELVLESAEWESYSTNYPVYTPQFMKVFSDRIPDEELQKFRQAWEKERQS